VDFPKDMRPRYSSKQNLYFSLECLVEFLLCIIEIIVNCIVCEREIGILASSLAMGLG
jgi:hypothetical protein